MIEPLPVPLEAALGVRMGGYFGQAHREHGVDLRTGQGVSELRGADGRVTGDAEVPADVVVVGIGARPNTQMLGQWMSTGSATPQSRSRTADSRVLDGGPRQRLYKTIWL